MFAGLVTAAGFKPVAGFENEFRVGSIPIHSRHYFSGLPAIGPRVPAFQVRLPDPGSAHVPCERGISKTYAIQLEADTSWSHAVVVIASS